jgi:hypothetical protein
MYCSVGALARAFRVTRPQHDDGTALAPQKMVPRGPISHQPAPEEGPVTPEPDPHTRGVTPNGASPATPPSSAVRTQGPSGVIATVCSK